ncbi:MAG: hypothetical protein Ct9H300mP11_13590 [Chloroflexota bacterium]|nr:MAG: hypothetical protein Ct9H300mP11_13590 [Chloroflexota bacterium]
MLEESIYLGTQIYLEAGVKFPGKVRMFEGDWYDGWVLLFPPGEKQGILKQYRGKRTLEMTGWATSDSMPWGRGADASLPYRTTQISTSWWNTSKLYLRRMFTL